jgi:Ca2+-binding EF-hand superfamily protein
LKPFFQDKDISKIGRVSFTRMRSILDNNKIPLSDRQYELLCENFACEEGSGEFNYVDFIEVLKQYEAES